MNGVLGSTSRGRFTIFYGILLALALVFYAAGTSVYLLHDLKRQLDVSLDRDIETIEGLLSLSPNGGIELRSEEGEADQDSPERGYLLEVWSTGDKLLHRSAALEGNPLNTIGQTSGRPAGYW
jgi:hypothetical protein